MAEWVERHIPCPCGQSSDAYSVNDAGWGTCFSCGKKFKDGSSGENRMNERKPRGLIPSGKSTALIKRKIDEDTCRKYGYFVGEDSDGEAVQVAPYHDSSGNVVAQKVRGKNKDFYVTGKMPGTFFGQHLFKGGKRVYVTEGEIDCLTVYQTLFRGKSAWPVVSLPNGAQSAVKAFKDNIEFLESFDEVVIVFDEDEAGRKARVEAAAILSPGKALIAQLSRKDPNEMLMAGEVGDLYRQLWEAPVWRPDSIINARDLIDEVMEPTIVGAPYPWEGLNRLTFGQHDGTITLWTGGSGLGKSAFVREIAYHAARSGVKVGYVALEENRRRTAKGFVGLHLNKPIHLPGHGVDEAKIRGAAEEILGGGMIEIYDHFGSVEEDNLFSRLTYMAHMGCKTIIVDHITIVMSGLDVEDERKAIDKTMTRLRTLAERTRVRLHVVCHLKRPQGKGHEEGVRPELSHLRGSHGLVQLSDFIVMLQRNSASPEEGVRNRTALWLGKNRLSGDTGPAALLRFDRSTGRLVELQWELDEDGEMTPKGVEAPHEETVDQDF